MIYVDLDRFKPVNDTLGHAAGDELLQRVAERLCEASRDSDLVGRLGGDEFLVVLHDVPGTEMAMRVSARIGESLREPFVLASGRVQLSASVGVICAAAGSASADELVRAADEAMYRSKDAGRGEPVLTSA